MNYRRITPRKASKRNYYSPRYLSNRRHRLIAHLQNLFNNTACVTIHSSAAADFIGVVVPKTNSSTPAGEANGMYVNGAVLIRKAGTAALKLPLCALVAVQYEEGVITASFLSPPEVILSGTITHINALLSPFGFYSPKKNSVINPAYVKTLDAGRKGYVYFHNNSRTEVSRDLKPGLRKRMKQSVFTPVQYCSNWKNCSDWKKCPVWQK